MYENDNHAGIERNVKTGSKSAVVVAVVITTLLFVLPQLSMQKIEGWFTNATSEDASVVWIDTTTKNVADQIPQNLETRAEDIQEKSASADPTQDLTASIQEDVKVQVENKPAPVPNTDEARQKAAQVSKRLPLLMAAVETDNLYMVKYLIEHGTQPDVQDVDGNEALAYVTDRTSPELIAYLLEQGLDINHRNKFQNTPLMFAIRYENVPAVRFMVEHGADVQATTRSGRTMASMARGPKVKAYLMSLDKPVPSVLTRVWWRQADLKDVQQAYDKNPQAFQSRKIFALAAANTPDTRVIQFLIDKGFDVNQVDETGITPIFSAASSNGNPDILRYLVAKGADVNRTDEIYDTTPLMAAAYFQQNPEIFKTLLSLGADPTLKDISGQTAVDHARRSNSDEVVSLLRKAIKNAR